MSNFITTDDYKPSVRSEILDAVIRQDQTALEMAEDRAIEEMKGYLATRYDADAIFTQTGGARNSLVLMFSIDITLYHLYSAVNRMKTPEERVERYKRAIEWLTQVADGLLSPNLPTKADPVTGDSDSLNPVNWGSEDKYRSGW